MRSSLASVSWHFHYLALPAAKQHPTHTKTLPFVVVVVVDFLHVKSLVVKLILSFIRITNNEQWIWVDVELTNFDIQKAHTTSPFCGITMIIHFGHNHHIYSRPQHIYLFTVSFIQSYMSSLILHETNLPQCMASSLVVLCRWYSRFAPRIQSHWDDAYIHNTTKQNKTKPYHLPLFSICRLSK